MTRLEKRKADRVGFSRGVSAQMMAIDGTWRRSCTMEDVSQAGARLTIEGSIEGLHLKEFFLLLSSTGLAYRRCELVKVNGATLEIRFLSTKPGKAGKAKRPATAEAADA